MRNRLPGLLSLPPISTLERISPLGCQITAELEVNLQPAGRKKQVFQAGQMGSAHLVPRSHSPAIGVVGDGGEEVEGQGSGDVICQLVLHQAQLDRKEAVKSQACSTVAVHSAPTLHPLTSPWLGLTRRTRLRSNSSSLTELWKEHSSTRTAVP